MRSTFLFLIPGRSDTMQHLTLSFWRISISIVRPMIIHVIANDMISFFLKAELYSSLCIYHILSEIIYLLAALGLHCCKQAFSSCSEWQLLFPAVHRWQLHLLQNMSSGCMGFSSCGSRSLDCELSSCGSWG